VEDINMDLREIRWGGVDWIDLVQDKDCWSDLDRLLRKSSAP
jgi:hypothetical protein